MTEQYIQGHFCEPVAPKVAWNSALDTTALSLDIGS